VHSGEAEEDQVTRVGAHRDRILRVVFIDRQMRAAVVVTDALQQLSDVRARRALEAGDVTVASRFHALRAWKPVPSLRCLAATVSSRLASLYDGAERRHEIWGQRQCGRSDGW
jgi:hypothetical protein